MDRNRNMKKLKIPNLMGKICQFSWEVRELWNTDMTLD